MTAKRVRVLISGRVQGVFYRDSARQRAEEFGVAGWICNLPDGRVEGVFEGPTGAVDAMVAWCRRGPPRSDVEDVAVRVEGDSEGFDGFVVRH